MNDPYYISKYSAEEIDAAIERILDPGTFAAQLTVTTRPGADVVAVSGAWSFSGMADENGIVILTITSPRTYAVIVTLGSGTDTGSITILQNGGAYNISVFPAVASLNDCTWAEISAISAAGQAAQHWRLGDTKTIHLLGSVGSLYADFDIEVFIIGFNHNAALEGNNLTHFQLGKINSVDIALIDSQYGTEGSSVGFRMNTTYTKIGGWRDSLMRNEVFGNAGTPTNPVANSLMSALPTDLLSVIKSCTKYSDNAGNSSAASTDITSTVDYFSIPSLFEYAGVLPSSANTYEQNFQAQYNFYKAGNTAAKHGQLDLPTAVMHWTRSTSTTSSRQFQAIGINGKYYTTQYGDGESPRRALGISPIFYV